MNWESFVKDHPHIWELFLVLLGVVLGLGASVVWSFSQDYSTDKFTAQGIYNELSNSDVSDFAVMYQHNWTLDGVDMGEQTGINLKPFIPENSMYPQIKEKLQRFDRKISTNVINYYQNLSDSENDRLQLIEIQKIVPNATHSFHEEVLLFRKKEIFDDMKGKVIYCANQIPNIKRQLQDAYGVK